MSGYAGCTGRTRADSSDDANTVIPGVSAAYLCHSGLLSLSRLNGRLPTPNAHRTSCSGAISQLTNVRAASTRAAPLSNTVHVSGPEIVTGCPLNVGSGTTS